MSCCNGPIIVYPRCAPDCPDVPEYLFQNANLIGEGVFKDNVDGTVSFLGVTNTDGTIEVSLDTVNNAISIDLNPELLAGNFPDATTTSKGKVELAIDAEALAKSSTTVVLTPSNLAALGSTTSFAGLVELATDAEAQAGTDTARAVTPASMALVLGPAFRLGTGNLTTIDTSAEFFGAKLELISGATLLTLNGSGVRLDGTPLTLASGADLNFNGAKLQLVGANMAASSLLGTTSTAGVPTAYALTNFLRFGETNATDAVDTYITITGGGSLTISNGTPSFTMASTGIYFGGLLNLGSTAKLNFDTGHIQVSGADVPADSFIRTDSAAGVVTSELVALYFGPHCTTEAWGFPAYVPDRNIDPATCTLTELATAFVTLVHDLEAVKRPTT